MAYVKRIMLLFLVFSATDAISCSCSPHSAHEYFMMSELVMRARIAKVYPNASREENYYIIDVIPINLYKGPVVTSLKVYGSSDGEMRSSCDLNVDENTDWIIYANRYQNGELSMGYCSGGSQIDRTFDHGLYPNAQNNHKESIQRELKVLELLKKESIASTTPEYIYENGNLSSCLEQYDEIKLKRDFAMFELTFNADMSLKKVKKLVGFKAGLDRALIEAIRKSTWLTYSDEKNSVSPATKWLVGIYFYLYEDEEVGFLSQFTL